MMTTRRIIKKKSKQAQKILINVFGYKPTAFYLAERGINSHSLKVRPKNCRRGDYCRQYGCYCYLSHPLKGTPMLGAMFGYYEPEYEEWTAIEELAKAVMFSNKPTVSDALWERIQRIAGCKPISDDELFA